MTATAPEEFKLLLTVAIESYMGYLTKKYPEGLYGPIDKSVIPSNEQLRDFHDRNTKFLFNEFISPSSH